jgi:hypothetical protein
MLTMRLFLVASLLASFIIKVPAQTRTKFGIGFSVNPSLTWNAPYSNSNRIANSWRNQTYPEYIDSVHAFETYKRNLGFTLMGSYNLSNNLQLQAGIGYSEVGFVREQNDIQFADSIFPGIGSGLVEENSSTGTEKSIQYRFRYQYLQIPIQANYLINRSKDYMWNNYLIAGVAANVLLQHEIKAKLYEFAVEGENVHYIDSTGYDPKPFTLNAFLGARFEYKIDKEWSAYAQPMFSIFPFSISNAPLQNRIWGAQLNIGVQYAITKDDE